MGCCRFRGQLVKERRHTHREGTAIARLMIGPKIARVWSVIDKAASEAQLMARHGGN